jgi:ribosomal protein S17
VKCDDVGSVVSWRGGEMKRVRRRCTNYRARARRLMIQGGIVIVREAMPLSKARVSGCLTAVTHGHIPVLGF